MLAGGALRLAAIQKYGAGGMVPNGHSLPIATMHEVWRHLTLRLQKAHLFAISNGATTGLKTPVYRALTRELGND